MTSAQNPVSPPAAVLREYYHLHFAGRPRITRNLTLLGQLIELARRGGNDTLAALWAREQKIIGDEQAAAGTAGRLVAQRVEQGLLVLHRARRLELDALRSKIIAVDVHGLRQVISDLADAADALAQATVDESQATIVARTREDLQRAQKACAVLIDQALQARQTGSADQRAQAGVYAAQLLLHSFASRIADRSGLIVRPERIEQLAAGLSDIAQDLSACGLTDPTHTANCQALQSQAAAWRAQGQRAAALRRQASPDELAHALAAQCDEVLDEGHSWPDIMAPYPEQMAKGLALCDRVDELVRQLIGIPLIYGLSEHHHTLSTVTDAWAYLTAQLDRHITANQQAEQQKQQA
jgi:hypothetical protein